MIQVKDLTKKFGAVVAVRDVSLDIKRGETFALLGPNGSGKTTILKCMIGLTHPTSGQIVVDGIDVWKRAREAKRLMSYLPQRVFFPDSLTARDVLRFYCKLRNIPINRIEKMLLATKFSFNGLAEKQISDFSGGMLQRLGLAVACLADAPVLVLDEPTISLDPEGAIHFREFLAALKREGRTIIFSSHMLADVEELADRVAILVGGQLIALQPIAALREELMGSSRMRVVLKNPADGLLEAARASGAKDVTLEGDSLVLTSRANDRLEILRAIESAGGRVECFATEELALEDIYMKYIREQGSQHK